jgi:hypothetical protein
MLGFETIGSAIVIAYDDAPILSCDAWISPHAYFGSWGHDYEIPAEQMQAIKQCKYHWMSHGHPDHLNVESLPDLGQGIILLADHFGGRIARDLRAMGHTVQIMPDGEWVQLSKNIKALSIANQNQDSIILIDVGGRLIINLNDSPDYGHGRLVRKIADQYDDSYLLMLNGWSGADMVNFYHADGHWLFDPVKLRKAVAPATQTLAMRYGAKKVIPFSSFHWFQRSDSQWANQLVPELADYHLGANPGWPPILPAFVRVDCETGAFTKLNPKRTPRTILPPEAFGDNWSEELDADERERLIAYFKKKELLNDQFGFVRFIVGGKETTIDFNPALREKGITFEAPRKSLMTSVDFEIFDDMLIGNYMKTTLHGVDGLYPHFSPVVAKYADNGGANSREEVAAYMRHYKRNDPVGAFLGWVDSNSQNLFKRAVAEDSGIYKAAQKLYWEMVRR